MRIGVHPADGAKHILIGGWRGGAGDQAVVDAHGEETEAGPLPNIDRAGVLPGSKIPSPAMDREDDGKLGAAGRPGDVREECRSVHVAIDDGVHLEPNPHHAKKN